jgi:hypothetical protein
VYTEGLSDCLAFNVGKPFDRLRALPVHIGGCKRLLDSPNRLKFTDYGGYSPTFLLNAASFGEVKKVPYLLEFRIDWVRSNPAEGFLVVVEY